MHIHILGICGTFMSGIAALAKEAGHHVTGCDANTYPPMSTQLEALGIPIHSGYDENQLALYPAQTFIIGNAISRGNPLLESILNLRKPYCSGPQWLAQHILQQRPIVAVAGTHGKTTTSAMIAWILEYAGQTPGFLIGGMMNHFPNSARLGNSNTPFVIEADEYDTAFFDKRSKFVHYRPDIAVLNNLEFDHADIFQNLADIQRQFHHLIRIIPSNGHILYNADYRALEEVLQQGCWSQLERFNEKTAWHTNEDVPPCIQYCDQSFGPLDWKLSGTHNLSNALAAIAACEKLGVLPQTSIEALHQFQSVKRRMEWIGCVRDIQVYDDFAHHPTAIETTLRGARQAYRGTGKIIAVFEPRSNTLKQGHLSDQLPLAFHSADEVFLYKAGVQWNVEQTFLNIQQKTRIYSDFEELVQAICHTARAQDQIIIMSNGGFCNIHQRILQQLASPL